LILFHLRIHSFILCCCAQISSLEFHRKIQLVTMTNKNKNKNFPFFSKFFYISKAILEFIVV